MDSLKNILALVFTVIDLLTPSIRILDLETSAAVCLLGIGLMLFGALYVGSRYVIASAHARVIAICMGLLCTLGIVHNFGDRLVLLSMPFFFLGRFIEGVAFVKSIDYLVTRFKKAFFSFTPSMCLSIANFVGVIITIHGLYLLALSIPQFRRNLAIAIGLCIGVAAAFITSPTFGEVLSIMETTASVDSPDMVPMFCTITFFSGFPFGIIGGISYVRRKPRT